jgi:uncharacterized protein (TIGR00730 family)
MKQIAVYCGSASGSDVRFAEAAANLGSTLAAAGVGLVYGGGNVGLMGIVADAVLAGGGSVTGVITDFLLGKEVAHLGLSDLRITTSMHERKALMAELADGVIALPGGFGTLDEVFEMLTWTQLGLQQVPVAFYDVDGFWTPLLGALDHMTVGGFLKPQHRELARRATNAHEAIDLALAPLAAGIHKWDEPNRA